MSTLPRKQLPERRAINYSQRSQSLEDLTYDLQHRDHALSGYKVNRCVSAESLARVNACTNIDDPELPPPKPPRRDVVFLVQYTISPPQSLGISLCVGYLDRNLWGREVKGRGYSFRRQLNGVCICVSDIRRGSVADDGRLKKGDEILAINGHTMETVSLDTAG